MQNREFSESDDRMANQDTTEALKSSPVAEFAAGAVGIEMETEPKPSDPMDKIRPQVTYVMSQSLPEWAKGMCVPPIRGETGKTTLPGRRPVKEVIAALILLAFALCIAFAVCTMVGCYAPDLTNTHYICVEAAPLCPDNQKCINGCCGGGPCKGAPTMPQGDMGGAVVADLSSAFDMTISLYKRGMAPPCKSTDGYRLENDVWACVGAFGGDPVGQCNQGYSPCTSNRAPTGCDWIGSTRLGCFITGARLAPFKEPMNAATAACGWTGKDATVSRGLAACGVCPTTAPAPSCAGGFPRGINCYEQTTPPSQTQTEVRCPRVDGTDSDYVYTWNQNASWGILCCPN